MKLNNITKKLGLLAIVAVVGIGSVGCGAKSSDSAQGAEKKEVKIGLVGNRDEVWQFVKKKVKKEDGIDLKIVNFSDYNQPNDALANKDIDLNAFQHRIFLENYNKEKGQNLTPIGDTLIAPLGIYSKKIKDVKDLNNNDEIVIPNDVTNEGRALKLLQTAGVIKLKNNAGDFATPKDIESNPKNIKITPVDASQTARTLNDVKVSIINSGMAIDAGLTPTKDAIFLEPVDKNSKPYVNIIVAREDEKDNPVYKKIVKAYQSEDTRKVIEETDKGSSVIAWDKKLD